MNSLGKFEDAFKAYESMNSYCSSLEDGCESCKYSLLNEMTDIPCCMFWMADHCFDEKAVKPTPAAMASKAKKDAVTVLPVQMVKRVMTALEGMIELSTGRKSGESEVEYKVRQTNTAANADATLGELEDLILKGEKQ